MQTECRTKQTRLFFMPRFSLSYRNHLYKGEFFEVFKDFPLLLFAVCKKVLTFGAYLDKKTINNQYYET